MTSATLKLKIFEQIESMKPSKLEEFYGLMINYFNKEKNDGWFDVTESEKDGIELAITELESGKGIPHETVMKNIRQKISAK